MQPQAITVEEVLTSAKSYDAQAHAAMRLARTIRLGERISLTFEDRQTALQALQSIVALEGLSCPVSLAAECEVAQEMWQGRHGNVRASLSVLPVQGMRPIALCAALAAPVASLRLEISGVGYPFVLEGVLAPQSLVYVRLPPAAVQALAQPAPKLAIVWQASVQERAEVPEAVYAEWRSL